LRERIEEESEKKSDALKALSKAQAEIQLWRSKFETEGLGRIDELARALNEADSTKKKLQVQLEYERVHAAAIISEKRGRNFDKVNLLLHNCLVSCTFKNCYAFKHWKLNT